MCDLKPRIYKSFTNIYMKGSLTFFYVMQYNYYNDK